MNARRALATASLLLLLGANSAQAAEHQVTVENYKFTPAELRISRGDTVKWTNNEKRVSHSVLFVSNGQESDRFFPGESWSRTFDEAGSYKYHCGPHPEMTGVIIVE